MVSWNCTGRPSKPSYNKIRQRLIFAAPRVGHTALRVGKTKQRLQLLTWIRVASRPAPCTPSRHDNKPPPNKNNADPPEPVLPPNGLRDPDGPVYGPFLFCLAEPRSRKRGDPARTGRSAPPAPQGPGHPNGARASLAV